MYNSMKWSKCCFTLGHDWELLPLAFERRRKLTYLKTNTGFSPSLCSHLMKTMSFDLCNTNKAIKNILPLPDPSPFKPAHSSVFLLLWFTASPNVRTSSTILQNSQKKKSQARNSRESFTDTGNTPRLYKR